MIYNAQKRNEKHYYHHVSSYIGRSVAIDFHLLFSAVLSMLTTADQTSLVNVDLNLCESVNLKYRTGGCVL